MPNDKKNIMLVEDEPLIAIFEKQQLESAGYSVTHLLKGEDAAAAVLDNDNCHDLILMDIDLGSGIDGTQTAEKILSQKDIPIVFLSSHTEPEIVEKTENITSYGYVVKNSGIVVLDASIKMAFRLFYSRQALKEKEKTLLYKHEFMSYVIEHNRSAVAVHDKNMLYLYVSKQYLDTYRVKEENVIGKHHYEVFPDLPQKWRDVHKRALEGEVLSADRDSYPRDDGTVDWTRWECRPWYEQDGAIGGIIVYTEIINDRINLEIELRESEQKYRTLVNSGQALIWTSDINKMCDYFNDPWLRFTGRSIEQELGNGWTAGVHPDDYEMCLKTYTDAFDERKQFSMVYRLRHHSGEYRWIQDDGTPRYNAEGEFIGYIGHCLDITNKKTG